MEGEFSNSVLGNRSAREHAEHLLAGGIPVSLTAHAVRDYLEQCQLALTVLGTDDSPLTVKLGAAQIAAAAQLSSTPAGVDAAVTKAAELQAQAARLEDEVASAYADLAWGYAHSGPDHTDERVRVAGAILETASRRRETALIPAAYILLLTGLLEQGEIRSLDVELLEQRSAASKGRGDRHPAGTVAAWFHCLRSILDGDVAAAERQATEIYEQAQREQSDALGLYTAQMGMIRWMQGRYEDLEPGFLAARREYPEQTIWFASLAWLWLLQGRRSAGERLLASLPEPEEIPRDRYWFSSMVVLAEIARTTGTRERAERLRDLLLPFVDHLVPVGIGVAFWGTCARTLGLLEERLGLLEDARAHLELAVSLAGRVGAMAWHAEAQIELAEFAIRHDLVDVDAYGLLEEAKATSTARGFPVLAQRAMYRPRIRVLGTFEVTSLCGVRAEWTSQKARELLKMLIAARGVATSREVFMDVLWPGEAPEQLGNRFSVAVNVIRRALDPKRSLPTQHFLVTEGDSVRLHTEHLDIDLERFFALAGRHDEPSRSAARRLYRGEAFSADVYSDWAVRVRERAKQLRADLD